MLGNGRLEAMCIDNVKRMCHIRGKMRKKVWVNTVSTQLFDMFFDFFHALRLSNHQVS